MAGNRAASIRDRLKTLADAERQDFQLVLTRYGLERLLYRLSASRHAERFLLKGALLFSLWYEQVHRPTRDADLLSVDMSDLHALVATFREVCAMGVDDGLDFDLDAIHGTEIRKASSYGGVRVDVAARLAGARLHLQFDVGMGDAVTPAPEVIRYPTLLPDLPEPRLLAYPKPTVIAEKLHAICLLGMANTRLKDYFDLAVLMRDPEIDTEAIRRAISTTFRRRGTAVPETCPTGLSARFAQDSDKRLQWNAFLRKNRMEEHDLSIVVADLRDRFLAQGVFR